MQQRVIVSIRHISFPASGFRVVRTCERGWTANLISCLVVELVAGVGKPSGALTFRPIQTTRDGAAARAARMFLDFLRRLIWTILGHFLRHAAARTKGESERRRWIFACSPRPEAQDCNCRIASREDATEQCRLHSKVGQHGDDRITTHVEMRAYYIVHVRAWVFGRAVAGRATAAEPKAVD